MTVNSKWQRKKLGEIFYIQRGGSPRPIDAYLTKDPNGVNWIKIGDTKNVSKYIYKTKEKIKPEGVKMSRIVEEGDFILSNSMSFGRPYIMKTTGCIHDGWLVLKEKTSGVDQNYLYYVLSSELIYRQFEKLASGSTVRNLNIDLVSNVEIAYPSSLAEQKQIVEVLDTVEGIRQKRKLSIQLLDNYVLSIFNQMFGQSEEKWLPLKEITRFIDYRGKTPKKTTQGITLITAKNVKEGYLDFSPEEYIAENDYENWMRRGFPKEGDVLFTTEAPLGNTAILPKFNKLAFAQRIIIMQPKTIITSEFLLFALNSGLVRQDIFKRATGSTVKGIRSKELGEVKIPVPSLSQQEKFSSIFKPQQAVKEKMILQSEQIEAEYKALMQRYFNLN